MLVRRISLQMNGVIWSLQKQGNTWIRHLIKKNFGKDCNIPLPHRKRVSNHAGYTEFDNIPRYHIVVRKEICSWLVSIHKWYTEGNAAKDHGGTCPKDFSKFLKWNFERRQPQFPRTVICPVDRKNMKVVSTGWSPVEYWNQYHRHWNNVEVCGEKIFVKYEDFITDFDISMQRIADRTGWTPLHKTWKQDGKYFMPSSNKDKKRTFDSKFYKDKGYMDAFSETDLKIVRNQLDRNLYVNMGYTLP